MNTKAIAIGVAIVVVLAAFYFLNRENLPALPGMNSTVTEQPTDLSSYRNAEYDISFRYPNHLFLTERDAGSATRSQLALVLAEDTEENRTVLEGRATEPREGPTAITVDVYPNPDRLSSAQWVQQDTNWTVATSGATEMTVSGREAVSFTWSGLYEGRSVIVVNDDKAYVLSVTWMTPEDTILDDFEAVLSSLTLE